MAFKFKMQKVLEYREQLEEEAKVRLASAEANLAKCHENVNALRSELQEAGEKAASKVMQAAEHWLHDQYIKGLHTDLKALELQERMLTQVAQEARDYLAARAMDRKILDKLKERQRIQYIHQEQKQEMNFNDEIATIRHKTSALQAG